MKITYSALSDRGPRRRENQDNLYCGGQCRRDLSSSGTFWTEGRSESPAVFAVADGMGGESNGAEVALRAVEALGELELPVSAADLTAHILRCNRVVCDMISSAEGERMGSTFVGLSLHDGVAEGVNLGDSRLYLYRNGQLTCLSRDHTVVRPLVEAGILTREEAKRHPDCHKLTQHIGIFPDELVIEPYCTSLTVDEGDQFLLCSDGLTDGLEEDRIAEILSGETAVEEKCRLLYRQAMERTRDNVTIILLSTDTVAEKKG